MTNATNNSTEDAAGPRRLEWLFLEDDPDVAEVWLIRHAETDYASADPERGATAHSAALTPWGRRQTLALAGRLVAFRFDAIYASTMARAIETARPLADALGLPVRLVDDLREIAISRDGERPALPQSAREFHARETEMRELLLVGLDWDAVFPGQEPAAEFRARCVRSIDGIFQTHPGQRVAVVAHGGVINAYLAHVLDVPRDMFFMPANTSISIVRGVEKLRVISRVNDAAHLEALGQRSEDVTPIADSEEPIPSR